MTYSAFRPAKEGDNPHASNERVVTLRILHTQSNGWILATQITYYYIPSEAPSGKMPERIKKESPPSWYNLNAFSEASEVGNGIKGCHPKLTGMEEISVLRTDSATDKPRALTE
jgi:hypothetical protein